MYHSSLKLTLETLLDLYIIQNKWGVEIFNIFFFLVYGGWGAWMKNEEQFT